MFPRRMVLGRRLEYRKVSHDRSFVDSVISTNISPAGLCHECVGPLLVTQEALPYNGQGCSCNFTRLLSFLNNRNGVYVNNSK